MDDQEKVVLITMRQVDSEPLPEFLGETFSSQSCDECDAPVYVTSTSFNRLREEGHTEYRIVCNVCAAVTIFEGLAAPEGLEVRAADRDFDEYVANNQEAVLAWMLWRSVTSNAEKE